MKYFNDYESKSRQEGIYAGWYLELFTFLYHIE